MVTRAGQGDPRRTMELLWRHHGETTATAVTRGPRPALTVDDIVAAAVAIADEDGLDALSMRAVGDRLGRTAMALYTYVPGKDELVDLMLDGVLLELDEPVDLAGGWRAAVRDWARRSWDFYLRHPWVHQAWARRPILGPGSYAATERPAAIFVGLGLTGAQILQVVATLSAFVVGMSRQVSEYRQSADDTGLSEQDWWELQSALFAEMAIDTRSRFPTMTQAETEGAFEFEHEPEAYLETEAVNALDFGLERLLDGIEAFLDRSGG